MSADGYPKLELENIGRGGGIKTSVLNFNEVCVYLQTPMNCTDLLSSVLLRFLTLSLGAQSRLRIAPNNGPILAEIMGQWRESDLRRVIDKYVQKFIQCVRRA